MILIAQKGLRSRYSPAEVRAQLGMTEQQIRRLVNKGLLKKSAGGRFPFLQKDVNAFLVRFNAGEID